MAPITRVYAPAGKDQKKKCLGPKPVFATWPPLKNFEPCAWGLIDLIGGLGNLKIRSCTVPRQPPTLSYTVLGKPR
jgi:hypothetical protein